jgi:hypothetical protein
MTAVEFFIPGSVPSAANLRECWPAKARRVKRQRQQAFLLARYGVGLTLAADVQACGGTITLTRCAPRKLDSDNLAGSLKATRDGIASALGVNDGDERIAWRYEQEKCRDGEQQIHVTIEAARVGCGQC